MQEQNKFVRKPGALKKHEEKIKPRWEIPLEKHIKNLRKEGKSIKQRKNAGTCSDKKETQHKKNDNPTWGKVLTKERRLKRHQESGETIQTISKQWKEILPTS